VCASCAAKAHYLSRACLMVCTCGMCAAIRIVAGVGYLVQRTGDGRIGRVLNDQTIEMSGGAMCDRHRARGDEERGYLG
jgi:hypothetical protein